MDLFVCTRHRGELTLSPQSCAGLWKRAHKDAVHDAGHALQPCLGCAIGAQHAGMPQPTLPAPACLCAWCGRTSIRLARGLCISCYNRLKEYVVGRDRRGHLPRREVTVYVVSIEEIEHGQQTSARGGSQRASRTTTR